MEKFDAIIIGAGVAGMTSAYELSKHYSNILVVERDEEIGGTVSSYDIDGFSIEKYYHHFFSHDMQLLDFVKDLGLEDKLIWQEAPTGYYFDNKLFNLNTPLEILNCQFLSLLDKLKLGFAMFKLKYTDNLSHLDGTTAKEWILKNTSIRVYENFFEPLLKSKFGNEPDISAAWLCARIKKRSNKNFKGEKLGYFKGGFKVFFEAIAARIERKVKILKASRVERILIENNKVNGVSVGGKEYLTDRVIITAGPKTVLDLCEVPYPLKEKLEKIKQQCIVCCLFGLRRSLIRPYWLNIKSKTLPFGILIEHNNFVNFKEYKDTRIIYAITYCENEDDNIFKLQDKEIADVYLRSLEDQFALKREEVAWWRISKSREAGPVYKKGLLDLIPEIKTGIDGLYLSGMIRSYPDRGINESIKDAQDCIGIIVNGDSR